MKQNGWRVVALGSAKVWHKGGFNKAAVNTLPKYYFLRNRLHFFSKYIPDTKVEEFIESILSDIFAFVYGYHTKEMHELFQTTIAAFDDFLHLKFGKAEDHKILQITDRKIPFEQMIEGKSRIEIGMIDNFHVEDHLDIYHVLLYIIGQIQKTDPKEKIWISLKETSCAEMEFREKWRQVLEIDKPIFLVPKVLISDGTEILDLRLQLCQHVKLVSRSILPVVYVDRYRNCITSEKDFAYFTGYKLNEELFKAIYRPLMEQAVNKIREQMNSHEG